MRVAKNFLRHPFYFEGKIDLAARKYSLLILRNYRNEIHNDITNDKNANNRIPN
jgi:hypothetical protein